MEFNYWMIAVEDQDSEEGQVRVKAFSSYSAAMSIARTVKYQNPTWRVVVEIVPAGDAHPDIGPYEEYSGMG